MLCNRGTMSMSAAFLFQIRGAPEAGAEQRRWSRSSALLEAGEVQTWHFLGPGHFWTPGKGLFLLHPDSSPFLMKTQSPPKQDGADPSGHAGQQVGPTHPEQQL